MLDTLISITDQFEDFGGIRFHSSKSIPDGLLLEIIVVPGDETDEQKWCIRCDGVRGYRLDYEFADRLLVVSEHPVLLPFVDPVTELYFYCPSPNPLSTVGGLWECHRQIVGSWIPFEQFINVLHKGLSALLSASSGELASGPITLMQAYSNVLIKHGVKSSMLPPRPPKYWDGRQWVVQTRSLSAIHFNSSYVVAERFDAERGEL